MNHSSAMVSITKYVPITLSALMVSNAAQSMRGVRHPLAVVILEQEIFYVRRIAKLERDFAYPVLPVDVNQGLNSVRISTTNCVLITLSALMDMSVAKRVVGAHHLVAAATLLTEMLPV